MMILPDPCRSIRGWWGNEMESPISVAIICIKVPSLRISGESASKTLSRKIVTLEHIKAEKGFLTTNADWTGMNHFCRGDKESCRYF